MTRTNIGGVLDMAAYADLASMHRPHDPAVMASEIRRLRATGLSARDVSVALRLPLDEVINVLGEDAHG